MHVNLFWSCRNNPWPMNILSSKPLQSCRVFTRIQASFAHMMCKRLYHSVIKNKNFLTQHPKYFSPNLDGLHPAKINRVPAQFHVHHMVFWLVTSLLFNQFLIETIKMELMQSRKPVTTNVHDILAGNLFLPCKSFQS